MATDDERREVAAKLRNERYEPWDDVACELALCVGVACCNEDCHGSEEEPECAELLAKALADLIEPAPEHTCRDFGGEEGTNGELFDFACGACGYCCDVSEPNYCPNCGARVVVE